MSSSTPRSNPTQLLASTNNYAISPKLISTSWSKISTGVSHVLGIKSNGRLYAWGYNNQGQLGDGTTVTKSSPVQIGSSTWNDAHAGPNYSIALRNDYIAFGWGYNDNGQLGDTITTGSYVSSPVQVNSTSWNSIATGTNHVIALQSDNTLWGWGTNSYGQLGQSLYAGFSSPVQISSSTYSIIDAGNNFSLAINSNNKLVAFGDNYGGQLGYTLPLTEPYSWTMIADSNDTTIAIRSDGLLFGWGSNGFGQLGLNDVIPRSSPTQIGSTSWSQIAVGISTQVLAITTLGKLFTWGNNIAGELGTGDVILRSSPVQIGTSSWSQVSAGASYSMGITTTGALFGWGLNSLGQTGLNDIIARSSPVQINNDSWSQVSAGTNHAVALKTDYTLWSWGGNAQGQLGINDVVNRSSPVQVGTSSWSLVTALISNTVAVKLNKKLYTWGYNNQGQLGNNSIISRSSPIQIHSNDWSTNASTLVGWSGTLSTAGSAGIQSDGSLWYLGGTTRAVITNAYGAAYSWAQISTGRSHTAAIRSDGRLFVWGVNAQGQLGLNDTITRSSPTQLGAVGNEGEFWYSVSASESRTVAIRCDNTLWAWGVNNGNTGISDTINRSSPTQLASAPTSSYTQVSAGQNHTLLLTNTNTAYYMGDTSAPTMLSVLQNGSSYQTISNNSVFNFGTGDATIECWFYNSTTPLTGQQQILIARWNSNTAWQLSLANTSGLVIQFQRNTDTLTTSVGSYVANTWYHVAVVRASNVYNIYLNGSSVASATYTGSWEEGGTGNITIAANDNGASNFYYGYISGVRITGSAVYTSAFTPANVAGVPMYALAQTQLLTCQSGTLGQTATFVDNSVNNFTVTNTNGNLGAVSTPPYVRIPPYTLLTAGTGSYTQLSAGISNSLVVDTNYKLYSWGDNTYGQLGTSIAPYQWSNVFEDKGGISLGQDVLFALRSDSTLWVWGTNRNGVFGTGEAATTARSSPVQVPGSWSSVGVGQSFALGIQTNGTLWGWGYNQAGILWDAFTINDARSSPVQMGSATNWSKLSVGSSNVAAINNIGQLYTWGNNTSGQLGLGDSTPRSSPVQVPGSWTQISNATTPQGFSDWALGLKTDGTAWGWGGNTNGQLGNNSVTSTNSPVQIAGVWRYVNAGYASGFGIRDNYTLWSWGSNSSGELGINAIAPANRSSPVQVSAPNSAFRSVTASVLGILAIRLDGTLLGWGPDNGRGTLGLGTTIARSSPTQVGTLSWSMVAISFSTTQGITAAGIPGTPGSGGSIDNLYAWGISIGNGASNARSSPVQINSGTQAYATTVSSPVQIGTSSWINVSAGASHSLGVTSLGKMFAWGDNFTNKLGYTVASNTISMPNNTFGYIRSSDNSLFLWGYGTSGQLGDSTIVNKSIPINVTVRTGISFRSIAQAKTSTTGYTLGIDSEYSLWAWGDNTNGRLGDNSTVGKSFPVMVSKTSWSQVAVGLNHSLGLKSDGTIWGWGAQPQAGYISWRSISAGLDHMVAVRSDYALFTWGNNANGQLGNNSVTGTSTPVRILTDRFITTAIAGASFTVAIDTESRLWAWGAGANGRLGNNATTNRSSPVQIGTSSWTALAAGFTHTLGILSNGTLYAWGQSINGALGNGLSTGNDVSSPVQISSSSWSTISAGTYTSAGISNFRLFVWGLNDIGQLGDNTVANKSSPTQIGSSSWTVVSTGASHMSAITTGSVLFTWGGNANGQLGTYDLINRSNPVQVNIPAVASSWSWSAVSSGASSTVGVANGKLYTWGSNTAGLLGYTSADWKFVGQGAALDNNGKLYTWGDVSGSGQNTTALRSSPVQLGTSSWIAVGSAGGFAIRLDGTLWSWYHPSAGAGSNFGQPGQNDIINRSSPVQVGTDTDWVYVDSSDLFRGAIKRDGRLYMWGRNQYGQLGTSDNIARSSPVQIPGSWTQVFMGVYAVNTFALKADGTLWAWGFNGGTLGLGDTVNRNSPTQVPGSWNMVKSVSGNSNYQWTLGIKSDGTLWGWGDNATGGIGDGTTVTRSSPVQVGTSSWSMVAATNNASAGISAFKLFTWGGWGTAGQYGGLGDGTTLRRSSPVQVGTSSWTFINSSYGGLFGITGVQGFNSALFAWGYDTTQYFLGTASTINRSSPVQIQAAVAGLGTNSLYPKLMGEIGAGVSSWSSVSAGTAGMIATTNEMVRNLYVWGTGQLGILGVGDTLNRSSPVQLGNALVTGARSSPSQIGTDSNWSVIAAADSASFAIKTNGTLWTWGVNTDGRLGLGDTINRSSIVQIGSGTDWSSISGGRAHVLARTTGNVVFSWGSNVYGQLGVDTAATFSRSSPIQVGTGFTSIATGESSSMALDTAGRVWNWGFNSSGQLGQNDVNIYRSSPVQVTALPANMESIVAGSLTHFAIKGNLLYAWGSGSSGELGDGTVTNKSSPVLATTVWTSTGTTASSPIQIGTDSSWTFVSASVSNSLAISSSSGTLFSWGNNSAGNMGDGTTINKSSPTQIATGFSVGVAGATASFALRSPTNLIAGWGTGGLVGDNTAVAKSSPVQVFTGTPGATVIVPLKLSTVSTSASSWTMVAIGKSGGTNGPPIAGILSNGLLYAWGYGSTGMLGNNDINTLTSSPIQVGNIRRTFYYSPTVVDSTNSYTAISAGYSHSLAIRSNNTLYGWGNIVAAGTAGIPAAASWKRILSDGQSFMARRGDDTLWVWGKNDQGQLGLSDTLNRSLPVQLGTDTYIDFVPGNSFAVAVKSNYTLWTWGRNNAGQLGLNDVVARSSPTQMGVGTSWSKVAAGFSHGLAIASDGKLYSWGGNPQGQLGLNDVVLRSSPTQVGTSSWTLITAGGAGQASAAIDINGTLYVWGYNIQGIQGNGDAIPRSSPVQFGATNYRKYSLVTLSGDYTLHAIATDGRLWATGFMAGTNDYINASIPTAIGTSSTDYWVDIVGSGTSLNTSYSVQAKKADGTLWTWGNNIQGKLGLNDVINRSSPVQLSAFTNGTPTCSGISFAPFIDSFGRLYTAGLGSLGELGDGQILVARSSPAQILPQYSISTPTQIVSGSWSAVSAGSDVSLIASSTGSLYAWGVNSSYQTGIGTGQLFVTSPVVIGSSISSASVGSTAAGYIK